MLLSQSNSLFLVVRLTNAFILLLLLGWSLTTIGQIRVNVNSPITPGLNLNGKKKELKKKFKQIKRDSLARINRRIEEIEQELETLEQTENQLPDSSLLADTSKLHFDSLYQTLSENEYIQQQLADELDSVEKLKHLIQWDSLGESYAAQQMQQYFQQKGLLPPPPTSPDPVGDFKKSLYEQNKITSMPFDPESFKDKEALSKEAMKQLAKLKSKYVKIDDMRHPENGVQKPSPFNKFSDRLVFGGQIDFNVRKNPTVDVKPNMGVFLAKRIRLMFDYSATYYLKPRITFLERDDKLSQKLGSFLDVDITRGFFARAKTQQDLNKPLEKLSDLNYSLGIGKTLTLYKGLKAQLVLNHSFQPNDHGKRWYVEYGIQQQGISNLFKKKDK